MQSIWLIIGVMFAVLFFGLAINTVLERTNTAETQKFISISPITNGSTTIISWETDTETDGVLYVNASGTESILRDHDYSTTHRLVVPETAFEFYIEACDIKGKCMKSIISIV